MASRVRFDPPLRRKGDSYNAQRQRRERMGIVIVVLLLLVVFLLVRMS
jgi:predicted nucleic acid-binding Zn ribbon protein